MFSYLRYPYHFAKFPAKLNFKDFAGRHVLVLNLSKWPASDKPNEQADE